jgi:hypothetical protein
MLCNPPIALDLGPAFGAGLVVSPDLTRKGPPTHGRRSGIALCACFNDEARTRCFTPKFCNCGPSKVSAHALLHAGALRLLCLELALQALQLFDHIGHHPVAVLIEEDDPNRYPPVRQSLPPQSPSCSSSLNASFHPFSRDSPVSKCNSATNRMVIGFLAALRSATRPHVALWKPSTCPASIAFVALLHFESGFPV